MKLRNFIKLLFICSMHATTPPTQIPAHLYNDFTLNRQVKVKPLYFNDTIQGNSSKTYSKEEVYNYLAKIGQKQMFYYGATDTWLYQALEKHPIKNQMVAVFGSVCPAYEAICLFYGGNPITIEYNKWTTDHPGLSCITPAEYDQNPILFDCGFSISSFEHDGLGRYGDPINPNADLETMKKVKKMIKPNGLLFLAVPVSSDLLAWNAHRIYGKIRLPLLLEGWEIIDFFGISGLNDPIFNNNDGFIQPIFVLKNSIQ